MGVQYVQRRAVFADVAVEETVFLDVLVEFPPLPHRDVAVVLFLVPEQLHDAECAVVAVLDLSVRQAHVRVIDRVCALALVVKYPEAVAAVGDHRFAPVHPLNNRPYQPLPLPRIEVPGLDGVPVPVIAAPVRRRPQRHAVAPRVLEPAGHMDGGGVNQARGMLARARRASAAHANACMTAWPGVFFADQ